MDKKFSVFLIISVTAILLSFVGGFYLGTLHQDDTVIQVSAPPQEEKPSTSQQQNQQETQAPQNQQSPQQEQQNQPQNTPVQNNKINLNTATAAELMELPGIGEKLSAAIVNYRSQIGTFQSIWQLDAVPGIGEKTIQKIEPYLTLS